MALILKDRVKETTTTTGTGTLTLAGAVTNFQAFSTIGNNNTTYYVIEDNTNNAWEVGIGTYTLSGTTLARTTILASSNAGSVVTLGAGTKNVFCAYPATNAVASGAPTNFTAQQYFGASTITDGATLSWTVDTQQVATVTIAGNRTFGAPTGMVNGGFYALNVIQDATGSRTITWNAVFKWAGGTAPTLSTTASAKDFFVFRSDGTNLYEQGRSIGVA
jgi:hypothetical protein